MARRVDIVKGLVGSFDLFPFARPDNLGAGVTFVCPLPSASSRALPCLVLPVLLGASALLMQAMLALLPREVLSQFGLAQRLHDYPVPLGILDLLVQQ